MFSGRWWFLLCALARNPNLIPILTPNTNPKQKRTRPGLPYHLGKTDKWLRSTVNYIMWFCSLSRKIWEFAFAATAPPPSRENEDGQITNVNWAKIRIEDVNLKTRNMQDNAKHFSDYSVEDARNIYITFRNNLNLSKHFPTPPPLKNFVKLIYTE
jgi:hypothetical protein